MKLMSNKRQFIQVVFYQKHGPRDYQSINSNMLSVTLSFEKVCSSRVHLINYWVSSNSFVRKQHTYLSYIYLLLRNGR
jgi:hypothetical protein